jgi:hypothetical protein
MNRFFFVAVVMLLYAIPSAAKADIVNLTPTDIHGDDTTTVQFSNADLTLTPFVGGVQNTFNGNADRLGIDGQGSNDNAFNDQDTTAGNGDDETLEFVFASNAGLAGISWDFSRADGPLATDGVNISGFLVDPMASFTGDAGVVATYSGGVLNLQLSGAEFKNPDTFMTLGVTGASAGQTLVLSVNDSTQGGAQLAITGMSYDNMTTAVPEPSSMALIGFAVVGLMASRKRAARLS